jgi:hypothetical protein
LDAISFLSSPPGRPIRLRPLPVLLLLLLSACAARQPDTVTPSPPVEVVNDEADWAFQDGETRDLFRRLADLATGTPYARGGTSLRAFDCSGFVRWAFSHLGVDLPRRAKDQGAFGKRIDRADLRFGDIVVFRHPKRGYHSGIYMGDNRLVHSSTASRRVRYSNMDGPYFNTTFIGARRVDPDDVRPDLLTERVLSGLAAEKAGIRAAGSGRGKAAAAKAPVRKRAGTGAKAAALSPAVRDNNG